MNCKEMLKELFLEADNGKIVIKVPKGEWCYNTQFSAVGKDNVSKNTNQDAVRFSVPDFDRLADKVEKYTEVASKFYSDDKDYYDLDDAGFVKHLAMFLFVNMTNYDLNSVEEFVENRMKMLANETKIKLGESKIGGFDDGEKVSFEFFSKISKNRSNMEAPFKFEIIARKDGEEFVLPAVYFGFDDKNMTIFGVQNLHKNQNDKLAKSLDRFFRKVNKNINPEEIESQVSPNAVVAMSIFLKCLKNSDINKVCVKDFMPIRYHSGVECRKIKLRRNLQDEDLAVEQADRDQYNMTNKLMYLMLRMGVHFDNIDVNFDDLKSEMQLIIKNQIATIDDNIIHKLTNSVDKQGNILREKERNL